MGDITVVNKLTSDDAEVNSLIVTDITTTNKMTSDDILVLSNVTIIGRLTTNELDYMTDITGGGGSNNITDLVLNTFRATGTSTFNGNVIVDSLSTIERAIYDDSPGTISSLNGASIIFKNNSGNSSYIGYVVYRPPTFTERGYENSTIIGYGESENSIYFEMRNNGNIIVYSNNVNFRNNVDIGGNQTITGNVIVNGRVTCNEIEYTTDVSSGGGGGGGGGGGTTFSDLFNTMTSFRVNNNGEPVFPSMNSTGFVFAEYFFTNNYNSYSPSYPPYNGQIALKNIRSDYIGVNSMELYDKLIIYSFNPSYINSIINSKLGYNHCTIQFKTDYSSSTHATISTAASTTANYVTGDMLFANASRVSLVVKTNGNVIVDQSLTQNSDISIKKNIEDTKLNECINILHSFNSKTYKRIDHDDDEYDVGFIAQDIKNNVPEKYKKIYGENGKKDNGEPFLTVDYSKICTILWPIVQCLEKKTNELEIKQSKIESLESKIESLEYRLSLLESKLST